MLVGCWLDCASEMSARDAVRQSPCGSLCTVVSSLLLADDPCSRVFLCMWTVFGWISVVLAFSQSRKMIVCNQVRMRRRNGHTSFFACLELISCLNQPRVYHYHNIVVSCEMALTFWSSVSALLPTTPRTNRSPKRSFIAIGR